jgi:hypothetical protein
MQSAVHIKTTVLPGHKIEIAIPELREGDPVEVFLVLPPMPVIAPRPALEIIEALEGHRLLETPRQVDQYLQGERDSWQS